MEKYADASWFKDTVENGQIRYQFGEGCLSDQLLGAWMATVLGLEPGWSSERMRKTLQSIYRYNFRNTFYDHPNTQRIYALNDEKGLLLCSWPKGGRPPLPFPYSDEVWTGIEFQVAAHMIYEGLVEEGLAIVKGVADRYDGVRRNPWNEIECGSHYARALASWSVLLALSGHRYSAKEQRMSFAPLLNPENFRCFFAAGSGWGAYQQKLRNSVLDVRLQVLHGEVRLQHLELKNETGATSVRVSALTGPGSGQLPGVRMSPDQQRIEIDFGSDFVIKVGNALTMSLSSR
jgi:non-lysosomal glucosylceramidase